MDNQLQNAAPQGAADGAAFNEAVRMEMLLLKARKELAEAEEVAAGRKVRITLHRDWRTDTLVLLVPFRVAAYARKAIGVPDVAYTGIKIVFSSQGLTVPLYPSIDGYDAFIDAILARQCAEHRRNKRYLRQRIAKLKKGGATL